LGVTSIGMDSVFEFGLKLPDVRESSYFGARALKVNGQMLACTPVNKSAEINSVVVAVSFERRAALLKKLPLLYYITDHYAGYPAMLIRLSKMSHAELERTLRMSWKFAGSMDAVQRSPGKAKRV
jgi:hypothetical protein